MHLLNLYNCLTTYLVIGALLFACGVYGMVVRRTVIGMLVASEFILAAASTTRPSSCSSPGPTRPSACACRRPAGRPCSPWSGGRRWPG